MVSFSRYFTICITYQPPLVFVGDKNVRIYVNISLSLLELKDSIWREIASVWGWALSCVINILRECEACLEAGSPVH